MSTSTPNPRLSAIAPDGVGATAIASQPPVPDQRSGLPVTVRRAPRLWSLLYDELSASDQRWVLDTIERHGRA